MNLRILPKFLTRLIPMMALCVAVLTIGADWPQFLGPARNGTYSGDDLTETWAKNGPATLWQRTIGQGFSGPVAANGKLILFHRLNDKEIIECLETKSGQTVWKFSYPATYRDDFGFDEGPRATPAV